MASLDGQFVFGAAVRIAMTPNADAAQIAAFFGASGVLSSYGGGRGRTFEVQGLFMGASILECVAARNVMASFADGLGHTLVDTYNETWPNVLFRGEMQTEGSPRPGVSNAGAGWYWPYKLVLHGLS